MNRGIVVRDKKLQNSCCTQTYRRVKHILADTQLVDKIENRDKTNT